MESKALPTPTTSPLRLTRMPPSRAREAGAEVDGPRDFYWGRSAYLRDPDGRAVELQPDT